MEKTLSLYFFGSRQDGKMKEKGCNFIYEEVEEIKFNVQFNHHTLMC